MIDVLLDKLLMGDNSVIDLLMKKIDPVIMRHSRSICKDEEIAEEVAQIARIRIHRSLGKFQKKASLSSWIYRVVKNIYLDYLKLEKKRNIESLDDIDNCDSYLALVDHTIGDFVDKIIGEEKNKIILDGISALSTDQKNIVRLYYFHDQQYEDIAKTLNIPVGTVKSRLTRARKSLEKEIKPRLEAFYSNNML